MAVLITGGSEGIGLELARLFARDGKDLILAARDPRKLKEAEKKIQEESHVSITLVSMDLSKDNAASKLYKALQDAHLSVDVLINNAGIGFAGCCWKIALSKEEEMVRLNDVTMMSLSKLYLKDFLEKGSGEIINIASTGAFQPGPYIAGYYASKAFTLSYTRAIASEAKGSGVKIYCYCPGPVDTAFYPKSGGKKTPGAVSAKACAAYLYHHRGRHVVIIPGMLNRLAAAVPSSIKMKLVKAMKKRNL